GDGDPRAWRDQAAAGVDGKQPPPGRYGGSGERQQRSSHTAEVEADRREDSAGDRGSAHADRQGHLRHLPRLRRAHRAGAAQRHPVDARLHYVQGKAELVSDATLAVLEEFYAEKLAALLRHQAGARLVSQYDFNNTYQYIINREDTQLSWIGNAIEELGGKLDGSQGEPDRGQRGKGDGAARAIFEEDSRDAQAFVDRWRPRIDGMVNARHARMLRLILGEVLEQKRFFDQALAGQTDLLGRRGNVLGPSPGAAWPGRAHREAPRAA